MTSENIPTQGNVIDRTDNVKAETSWVLVCPISNWTRM
eukprot:CAMPEP_0114004342 /NCGR_PEP_ID=MMETSP0372-20130328/2579_1 /TAXON_ID=340204 /ORGANISM="Lankesteria abbotti" /LENGTH=37 /assembly_acc=CAM_ASM_000359